MNLGRLGNQTKTDLNNKVTRLGLRSHIAPFVSNERIYISTERLLISIIILAVILRLASAVLQGNTIDALPGIADQKSYHLLAQRVADGYGFSFAEGHWPATRGGEPTAHWSYAYTLYLAVLYSIFGVLPIVPRIFQAILIGVFHTWFAWRIGGRIFGQKVGIVSAALSAVYIYFVYYSGALLTEGFYIVGIMWALNVSMRIAEYARSADTKIQTEIVPLRLWLELGLSLAITILLRQVFLLFVPVLAVWIWWNLYSGIRIRQPGTQHHVTWSVLKGAGITIFMIGLLILPWTIRNYRAFNNFVPLNTNAGFAFFWGNHPIHGKNFIPILPSEGTSYQDLIPSEFLALNEAEMDQALLKMGLHFVAEDPGRYAILSLSRALEYFKFWPSSESSNLSNISRVGSFGLFLPFIIYGLWRSMIIVRKPANMLQRSEILLLYLFICFYTLIHLLTWTLIRYRLPVDSVLLIFAAYGFSDLYKRLIQKNAHPLPGN